MSPLAKRRLECGFSREDLGAKVEATGEAVRYWELGRRTPSAEYYPRLAKALKVAAADVIGWFPKNSSAKQPASAGK
jgi:transcriptional regulator with XRE-family HTH domain